MLEAKEEVHRSRIELDRRSRIGETKSRGRKDDLSRRKNPWIKR